ncbi:MAG: hypothetical protein ABI551_07945 [Polyangiaceae bacterium]
MSDPRRLLTSDDAGALEKEMWASWRAEGPSPATRAKTLTALGLGAGIAATGSLAPKALSGVTAIVKWLTAVIVVGAASTTAIVVLRARTPVDATPLVSTSRAQVPLLESAAPPPLSITSDLPAVEPSSLPVVPPLSPVPQRTPRRVSAPDLAPQIALLDRARSSVTDGDPARALDLVRRYRRDYPGGAFQQEADVVEIEALEKDGDSDGAKTAARRFLAAHPTSPYTAQVRASTGL